jgi:hypothetical protein
VVYGAQEYPSLEAEGAVALCLFGESVVSFAVCAVETVAGGLRCYVQRMGDLLLHEPAGPVTYNLRCLSSRAWTPQIGIRNGARMPFLRFGRPGGVGIGDRYPILLPFLDPMIIQIGRSGNLTLDRRLSVSDHDSPLRELLDSGVGLRYARNG